MKNIALFYPYVSWLARIYALIVLSGKQIAEGPVVKQFEKEFGRRFHKRNVVSLNSGTSALELAYILAGVGPGDEVITPVLTCTATNLPLVHRGAKIVFADINDTLNIDPEDVERKITAKTKAIVFVHFGGNPSGLRQLMVLARRHGIRVIEDAAQSVGAPCPAWGQADFTCVSLQAIKTLTAGDGGFLICRDPADAARAKRLRWFGFDRDRKQKEGDIDFEEAGFKYHMNDITAAIGLGNLRRIDYAIRKRAQVRAWYVEEAARYEWPNDVWLDLHPWLAILRIPNVSRFQSWMKVRGIPSSPYHYRNDKYAAFGYRSPDTDFAARRGVFPNMDRLEDAYTLLPFHHKITRAQVRYIIGELAYYVWR